MLHTIGHILFGLIVGVVAKLIMPGKDRGGMIVTAIWGMAGAWLGGLIGRRLGWYKEGSSAGFFMALIGAIIILAVYRYAFGA
jgi:uncharacterized membrane protein YeaQ/YmgE (transglycosylase-associated protein family)